MKKTIKETRELMDNINEFMSENVTPTEVADDFKLKYGNELKTKLGQDWMQTWNLDEKTKDYIENLSWEFVEKNYPELSNLKTGLSHDFMNDVMAEI